MVNFGPLAAEIASVIWGTQANFNGFRVLASLLHGIRAVGASQTAGLNRGRHLCSAGRPSRWALAHISSLVIFDKLNPEETSHQTITNLSTALVKCSHYTLFSETNTLRVANKASIR